jgi:hypothetical protein
MSTRQQGRHNKTTSVCPHCKQIVRSLPRHMRRKHSEKVKKFFGYNKV